MSFNSNHINTIHPGNYQEYFILYIDNELSAAEIKLVDAFLLSHPDLYAEFEALLSTKLPPEECFFDKKNLAAECMKAHFIHEQLLLYIDNELSDTEKKQIEQQLHSDTTYQLQHQLLLKATLNASDVVPYPNKEDLYHKAAKTILWKRWISVAAAVLFAIATGVFYFTNERTSVQSFVATNTARLQLIDTNANERTIKENSSTQPFIASSSEAPQRLIEKKNINPPTNKNVVLPTITNKDVTATQPQLLMRETVSLNIKNTIGITQANIQPSKEINNTSIVTSTLSQRTTINTALADNVADNSGKGSLRGFLRKATRVIERKTGIDPTNGNEEVLFGFVAVKLN